jgi:hypothetical protein
MRILPGFAMQLAGFIANDEFSSVDLCGDLCVLCGDIAAIDHPLATETRRA